MSNAAKLKKKAAEFEQKKQFDKALLLYIQILDESAGADEEGDVALYNRVGDLLMRQGNVGDAMTYYEKAVDLYAEHGFFNNAIALCNKILRQSPGRNSIYYKLGKISAKKGFISDAKQNFLEYASRMQNSGQLDEAFRALKEFADLCPDQDDIRLMLADQLSKKDRKGEALEQLQLLYEKFESEGRGSDMRATVDRMKAIDPEAQPKTGGGPRSQKSSDLVFIDVDDDSGQPTRHGAGGRPGPPPRVAPPPTKTRTSGPVRAPAPGRPAARHPIAEPPSGPIPDLPLVEPGPALDEGEGTMPGPMGTGPVAPHAVPAVSAPTGFEPSTLDAELSLALDGVMPSLSGLEPPMSGEEFAALRLATPLDVPVIELPEHDLALPGELPPIGFGSGVVPVPGAGSFTSEMELIIPEGDLPSHRSRPSAPTAMPPGRRSGGARRHSRPVEAPPATTADGDLPAADVDEPQPLAETRTTPPASDAVVEPLPLVRGAEVLEVPDAVGDRVDDAAADTASTQVEDQDLSDGVLAESDLDDDDLDEEALDEDAEEEDDEEEDDEDEEESDEEESDEEESDEDEGDEDEDDDTEESDLGDEELGAITADDDRDAVEDTAVSQAAEAPDTVERAPKETARAAAGARNEPEDDRAIELPTWMQQAAHHQATNRPAPPPPSGPAAGRAPDSPPAAHGTPSLGARRLSGGTLARTADALRVRAAANPGDWDLRRRLAEALLDAGERDNGLQELEVAMIGLERAQDLEAAHSVADEIIRLKPNSVRHHQKRVEYAFRTNDRARLPEAYLELADALFRSGQADKARAVYHRVLELAPDDARAQAALSTFGDVPVSPPAGQARETRDAPGTGEARPASTPAPRRLSGEGRRSEAALAARKAGRPTPPPGRAPAPGPVGRASGASQAGAPAARPPVADAPRPATSDDDNFVNLGDWLRDDEQPKSTRMVIDEDAPTGDEEADFADMLRKFKQGIAQNVAEEDHDSHYDLGVAYKEMGLVDEAIAEFQKSLRGPRHRVRTYEALGQCFIEKQQFQVAATILGRALNEPGVTDDQLVGVLYLMGYASEALMHWEAAVTYYQRVFAVDIQFRDVARRLATLERAPH
jgi:tetratricopeptide (TPR) repeat protein